MIETLVINLDRSPERLRFMRAQFDALGLSFTRLAGVDGQALVPGSAQAAGYAPLSVGEIGCFESHRKAWRTVLERNLSHAMILEDDVAVADDLGTLAFDPGFLAATDVIKIDTERRPTELGAEGRACGPDRSVRRLVGDENSTGGYVVTRRGAERLLRRSRGYVQAVDRFMFHRSSPTFYGSVIWKLCPSAVTQIRYFMNEEELHEDLYDGIGVRMRDRVEARPEASGLNGQRLRLRRAGDRGRRLVLRAWHGRAVGGNGPKATVSEAVPYVTGSEAHVAAGLAAMTRD